MQTQEKGQLEKFTDFIKFHGQEQLVLSLRSVHDMVIYGRGKRLSRKKRDELHDLNLLADQISQLEV